MSKMSFISTLLFAAALISPVTALPSGPWGEPPALQQAIHQNVLGTPAHAPKHGAVASQNQRCADIGAEMLKHGGSAADAVRIIYLLVPIQFKV